MPICTTCTQPTPYLYTVYQSAYNLRLEQCTVCHAFADLYVEHDTLMLLLDLILLKRDVYRHLLFNRGLGARKVGQVGISSTIVTSNGCEQETGTWGTMPQTGNDNGPPNRSMEQARWLLILELGAALVTVDAFIRWTHLSSASSFDGLEGDIASWTNDAIEGFIRIFAGCLVETVAFHAGIILACYLVLTCLNWLHSFKPHLQVAIQTPGIRQEFRSVSSMENDCEISGSPPDRSPADIRISLSLYCTLP
ncbi:hypothetical protein AcW1_008419 [Taiwanofungus camphoratus]|nr:hypothetical protein AcV5_008711 [Antrodia cinnamomea]KAI0951358.1 hypothetical protein AcW1_008419 [Antrodia cinnamomea]